MRLSWLELGGFRSYDDVRWEPEPGVNVLVGANAAGKTNLIEAVGYLASLRSFRGVPDQVLINDAGDQAVLRGEIARGGSDVLIEVEIPRGGRRRAQVNRQRLARVADMLGHVRSVVFLPDDLDMVKRGPAHRRDYLDTTAVQIWPGAYADQQDYEKALRQRNSLLRQSGRETDRTTLSVWDARLSEAGGMVMARRAAVMGALMSRIEEVYNGLASPSDPDSRLSVEIDYQSTWDHQAGSDAGGYATQLHAALESAHRADMERRVTTVGPHRDDPVIMLGGRDVRTRASQGEQRTVTLSMRVAAHHAIAEAVGEAPLLLLDDVFSELDMHRARALADALPDAQTFITTARDEEVPVAGRRWAIEGGGIT